MDDKQPGQPAGAPNDEWFAPTSWTVIQTAKQADLPAAREALETLCQTYWYPLYAYVRRLRYSPEDAEDLTQAFFCRLLGQNFLEVVDRKKGKFRSFLLVALKNFLGNEREYQQAAKRGGGKTIISLDEESAEHRYANEPVCDLSPEKSFEKDWAATIVERVHRQLLEEYRESDKLENFERLKIFLTQETAQGDYKKLAAQLGISPNAVAVTVYRLRQRYAELVRKQIAQTVASPKDLDEEVRHFFVVLAGS